MKIGQASGLQVAFLSFGVMLLAVPATHLLSRVLDLKGAALVLVEKGGHFFIGAALVVAIPPLRRAVADMLRTAVPRRMRLEVIAAWIVLEAAAFGGMAALALWLLVQDGPGWVARMSRDVDRQIASSLTGSGVVILVLSSTIGPIMEEILFRGLIYRAFERQWGWFASLIATSVLFGLYHPHFWSAFTASVILVCLFRRTGSLRAPIVVHMVSNFLLWPPLLGQHVLPRPEALADPASWVVRGACLAIATIAVPTYVYMARDRKVAPTAYLDRDAALPK